MRKADDLRRWLTAYIPELKIHPDRLQIYLEAGAINARRSRSLSFVYSYTLKALITDFSADVDTITVPILAWIEKEQPQLLARADSQPFAFEAELLDSDTFDIEISLDVTETVLVKLLSDGTGYDVQHPPEPGTGDAFADVSATFLQGFGNADVLEQTVAPGAVLNPAVPPAA